MTNIFCNSVGAIHELPLHCDEKPYNHFYCNIQKSMSNEFRQLLQKVGSGTHTSEHLTRAEASQAMAMILEEKATPTQIGAFLIAHRIKRPTGEELAGMLDAYTSLGPQLAHHPSGLTTTVFGIPYDGRTRTLPLAPITALLLAAVGVPVIMHGGERMATKEGLPLIEIWQGLGIDFSQLSLKNTQEVFNQTGLGFIYLPRHFPLTTNLVKYRWEIGKRPPIATMELIWCPYQGKSHLISGYVHPPTAGLFRQALELREYNTFTVIKGLEGSCDLPRDRTVIIGIPPQSDSSTNQGYRPDPTNGDRINEKDGLIHFFLHPPEYGYGGKEIPLKSDAEAIHDLHQILQGQAGEPLATAIWNSGFYLWHCGISDNLKAGLAEAEKLLTGGKVAEQLGKIGQLINQLIN